MYNFLLFRPPRLDDNNADKILYFEVIYLFSFSKSSCFSDPPSCCGSPHHTPLTLLFNVDVRCVCLCFAQSCVCASLVRDGEIVGGSGWTRGGAWKGGAARSHISNIYDTRSRFRGAEYACRKKTRP